MKRTINLLIPVVLCLCVISIVWTIAKARGIYFGMDQVFAGVGSGVEIYCTSSGCNPCEPVPESSDIPTSPPVESTPGSPASASFDTVTKNNLGNAGVYGANTASIFDESIDIAYYEVSGHTEIPHFGEDGTNNAFTLDSGSSTNFTSYSGVETLVGEETGGEWTKFTLTQQDGTIKEFEEVSTDKWRVTKVTKGSGPKCEYTIDHNPTGGEDYIIEDHLGNELTFTTVDKANPNDGYYKYVTNEFKSRVRYSYDDSDVLEGVCYQEEVSSVWTDRLGYQYEYDATYTDNIAKVKDLDGDLIVEYTYNSDDRVTAVKRKFDGSYLTSETYTYSNTDNDAGDAYDVVLTKTITDPDGKKKRIRVMVDDGASTGRAIERVVQEIDYVDGSDNEYFITSKTYNELGQLVIIEKPNGNGVVYTYDDNGNITAKSIRPDVDNSSTDDINWAYEYDTSGYNVVKKVTDPLGNETNYYYDFEEATSGDLNGDSITTQTFGNLVKKSYYTMTDETDAPDSTITEIWTYNSDGQLLSYKNPELITWSFTYNSNGQIATEVEPYDSGTSTTYTTTYTYGSNGQVSKITFDDNKYIDYEYDSLGRMIKQSSLKGGTPTTYNETVYTYNNRGQLTSVKLQDNTATPVVQRETTYVYDDDCGWLTREYTTYDHDGSSGTAKINTNTHYVYYDSGKIEYIKGPEDSATSGDNTITYRQYDNRGMLWKESKADGETYEQTIEYNYDDNGNMLTKTVPRHATLTYTTTYEYDGFDRVSKIWYPEYGFSTISTWDTEYTDQDYITFEYCKMGTLLKKTWWDNLATDKAIAEIEQIVETTEPGRITMQKQKYDNSGSLQTVNTTTFYRDFWMPLNDGHSSSGSPCQGDLYGSNTIAGNVRYVVDTHGSQTDILYWDNGQKKKTIDPLDNYVSYDYNCHGAVTEVERWLDDEAGESDDITITQTYVYETATGNLEKVYDNADNQVSFEYDVWGQVTKKLVEDDTSTYEYDETDFTYDGLGNKLTQDIVWGTDGIDTTWTYNKEGQVSSVKDDNNKITSYDYDKMGRIIEIAYPDGGEKTISYRLDSLAYEVVDQNGTTIRNTYDRNGRLTGRTFPTLGDNIHMDTDELSYGHDTIGRLTECIAYDASETFLYKNEYDYSLHTEYSPDYGVYVISDTTINPTPYEYNSHVFYYDSSNRIGQIKYTATKMVDYDYKDNGLIDNVSFEGTEIFNSSYYIGNLLKRAVYDTAGDVEINCSYDAIGRMTGKWYEDSSSNNLIGYDYGWDHAGNKLFADNVMNGDLGKEFQYDSANRLIEYLEGDLNVSNEITSPTYEKEWTLDGVDNWKDTLIDSEAGKNYTVNAVNEIEAIESIGLASELSVIYVDVDADDATWPAQNDGSTWALAYNGVTGLKDALDNASSGDEVWVAEGTYKATTTTTRNIYHTIPSGVKVYGGFDGTETARSQRDWENNECVVSGDLDGDEVFPDINQDAYHVFEQSSGQQDFLLDGFTVEYTHYYSSSGALYFGGTAFEGVFRNCTFQYNYGHQFGGVAYIPNGDATFDNCIFYDNTTGYFKTIRGGGAITANTSNASIVVKNCIFEDNYGQKYGGAILLLGYAYATIENCLFDGNSASYGGAIYSETSNATVTNTTFTNNSGSYYGVIYNQRNYMWIKNCIVYGNSTSPGDDLGGGLAVIYSDIEEGHAGTGNISDDPDFVNDANGDYRLESTSPCIDTGTTEETSLYGDDPIYDIEGTFRDSQPDMGCYEYPSDPNTVGDDITTLSYDANGNLICDGTYRYFYDYANRITLVTKADDEDWYYAEYCYDALGRLVQKYVDKNSDGDCTDAADEQYNYFYYGNRIIEQHKNDSHDRDFVYGAYIDEPLMMDDGTDEYYYAQDQQYNVVALFDSSGNIEERYEYKPYGETTIYTGDGGDSDWWDGDETTGTVSAVGNPYLYTGRRYEDQFEMYHFRNRTYNPELGRFMQRDPLGYVDGMNLYANYFAPSGVDPLGLVETEPNDITPYIFHLIYDPALTAGHPSRIPELYGAQTLFHFKRILNNCVSREAKKPRCIAIVARFQPVNLGMTYEEAKEFAESNSYNDRKFNNISIGKNDDGKYGEQIYGIYTHETRSLNSSAGSAVYGELVTFTNPSRFETLADNPYSSMAAVLIHETFLHGLLNKKGHPSDAEDFVDIDAGWGSGNPNATLTSGTCRKILDALGIDLK